MGSPSPIVAPDSETRVRKTAIGAALLLVLALPLLYPLVVVPLTPGQQAEVALALLGLALLASQRRSMRPLIMLLSCFASMRYFYWRVSSTLRLDAMPDALVSVLLLGAETYGLIVLLLGYFQTVEVHPRTPRSHTGTPSVDVFVPTYNEPTEIVRRTLIGALAIDYPRKEVYVLDDGKRPEVEELARRLGCHYLTRPDNRHAKAGNLNHALSHSSGELIAIFDADHVPVRGFLRKSLGFFEDERVALVQTAQHFFNPDPFERNLKLTGRIAPEQAFFYHVVQPGNDFWNSAFFCGSSAVVRRSAIAAIGGFKTDTVTEDAHTALQLHAQGYRSVYLPLPLAAGLATETLGAHVKQRMRWARGMVQILRLDCPLLKKGLTLSQRLNYFNATLHFFFGLPRLILILAPLSFLLFGIHPLRADALALFAYILPHLGLSVLANSMLGDRFRHSFWAGVYEVSIAPYTAWVTLLAVTNPRLGKFNVTDKGTGVDRARMDYANAWPTLVMLGLSALALTVALPLRLWLFDRGVWEPNELNAILINSVWALANFWTLLAAVCVAYEQPQQREAPRLRRRMPCTLRFADSLVQARTLDVSENGARLALPRAVALPDECRLEIRDEAGGVIALRAEPRWCDWLVSKEVEVGFRFVEVDGATHRRLVELLFSPDESWLEHSHPRDDPFRSFAYLLGTVRRVAQPRRAQSRRSPRIAGRWPCTVGGVAATCLSLSPEGAELRLDRMLAPAGGPHALAFELAAGRLMEVKGVVASAAEGRFGVAFEWPSFAEKEAFARVLYGHEPVQVVPQPILEQGALEVSRT